MNVRVSLSDITRAMAPENSQVAQKRDKQGHRQNTTQSEAQNLEYSVVKVKGPISSESKVVVNKLNDLKKKMFLMKKNTAVPIAQKRVSQKSAGLSRKNTETRKPNRKKPAATHKQRTDVRKISSTSRRKPSTITHGRDRRPRSQLRATGKDPSKRRDASSARQQVSRRPTNPCVTHLESCAPPSIKHHEQSPLGEIECVGTTAKTNIVRMATPKARRQKSGPEPDAPHTAITLADTPQATGPTHAKNPQPKITGVQYRDNPASVGYRNLHLQKMDTNSIADRFQARIRTAKGVGLRNSSPTTDAQTPHDTAFSPHVSKSKKKFVTVSGTAVAPGKSVADLERQIEQAAADKQFLRAAMLHAQLKQLREAPPPQLIDNFADSAASATNASLLDVKSPSLTPYLPSQHRPVGLEENNGHASFGAGRAAQVSMASPAELPSGTDSMIMSPNSCFSPAKALKPRADGSHKMEHWQPTEKLTDRRKIETIVANPKIPCEDKIKALSARLRKFKTDRVCCCPRSLGLSIVTFSHVC